MRPPSAPARDSKTNSPHEIPADWAPEASRDAALRYAVLGTVLFEPFVLALRRMAHCAHTRAAMRAVSAGATRERAKRPAPKAAFARAKRSKKGG